MGRGSVDVCCPGPPCLPRRKVFIPLALLAAAAGVVVPIVLKAKGRN